MCLTFLAVRGSHALPLAERGYAVSYRLQVQRLARLATTGGSGTYLLTVWDRTGVISGPPGEANNHVLEVLEEVVTAFAADYYKAGNP